MEFLQYYFVNSYKNLTQALMIHSKFFFFFFKLLYLYLNGFIVQNKNLHSGLYK